MGTNRVFSIGSAAFPRAAEIIAIDPDANPDPAARCSGLDDARLQRELAADGPRLVQWVARAAPDGCRVGRPGAHRHRRRPRARRGARATPPGELRWRIAVPDDGARASPALPLLIEWATFTPPITCRESGVH